MVSTLVAAPDAAKAEDSAYLTLGVGRYDVADNQKAVEFRAEYHSAYKLWIFSPFAGVMATNKKAIYGYGGVQYDLSLGEHFVLSPSFAAGFYGDGDGKNLGHTVEFRSSIELAYRFDNRSRLGLSLYHLSNAGLSGNNQGTEILSLSYSFPLDSR